MHRNDALSVADGMTAFGKGRAAPKVLEPIRKEQR
jgi:hypothetical protein